jgi:hypothetical protein
MHMCTLCVHALRLLCVPVYVLLFLLILAYLPYFEEIKGGL